MVYFNGLADFDTERPFVGDMKYFSA